MTEEIKNIKWVDVSYDGRRTVIKLEASDGNLEISDGRCEICEQWTRTIEIDTSGYEYGTINICKKCFDKIYKKYNGRLRVKK